MKAIFYKLLYYDVSHIFIKAYSYDCFVMGFYLLGQRIQLQLTLGHISSSKRKA